MGLLDRLFQRGESADEALRCCVAECLDALMN